MDVKKPAAILLIQHVFHEIKIVCEQKGSEE